jgi:hypothetical protein
MRLLGLLVLVGCAHNVPQDRSTGPDGRVKGATPLVFENGEARERGIVTYPGGDRVDWKLIELPEKQKGKLDLQLTWKTPRPGLQVAFDVFDQYNTPIVATAAAKRTSGRTRTATINDAVGKYFVRVYAPKRGDAGAYTLTASFEPVDDTGVDVTKVPIPDPPKLAAIPPPPPTCETFDPTNKACVNACPFDAPDDWKGCEKRTIEKKKGIEEEERRKRIAECLANQPKSIKARVIHVEVGGDGVNVKLDIGTQDQDKLTTGWSARVLSESTNNPLANGRVKLQNVGTTLTRATSTLTTDQVNKNPWVELTPPPADCR